MLYYNTNVAGGGYLPATPPVYSSDNLGYGAGGVVTTPPTIKFTNVVQNNNQVVNLFKLDLGPQEPKVEPEEVPLPGFRNLLLDEPKQVNLIKIDSSLELHSEIEYIDKPNFKEKVQRTYPTSYQYPIGYGNIHNYPTAAPQPENMSPMLLTPMDKMNMMGVSHREEINPDGTKSLVTEGLLNKLKAEKNAQAQQSNPANRQLFGQVMQPRQYMNYTPQPYGLRAPAYVNHYASPDEIIQTYSAQGINPLEVDYRIPVPTDYRGIPISANPTVISESDLDAEMRNRGYRVGQKRQKPATFLASNPQFAKPYNPMDDPQIPDRFKRMMDKPTQPSNNGVVNIGMAEFAKFRQTGAMVDDMVSSYAEVSRQMELEKKTPISELVNKPPEVDLSTPVGKYDPNCVGAAFDADQSQSPRGFISVGGYNGGYSNPFQAAQARLQTQNLIRQDMQRECDIMNALSRASGSYLGEDITETVFSPSTYFGIEDIEDDDHILTQEEYDKKRKEVFFEMHRQNIAFIEAQKCGPWYDQQQMWYLQKAAELEKFHKSQIPDNVGMLEFFEKYAGEQVLEYDMYIASQNNNDLSKRFNTEAYKNYLMKDFQGGSVGFGARILDPACMDDKEVALPVYTEEELKQRRLSFINAVMNIGKGRD